MKNTLILLLFSTILLLSACSKENLFSGDQFYIENKGASMPAFVKGNIDSRTFVIFLHGGPGGNASQASLLPVFTELEAEYALVYWDQRGSGLSLGNPDKSTFTVEQFVEDLDLLVETIRIRYDNPTIFLYGISWGGALGSAYLSTGELQDKITGFINMDSGHNLVEGLPLSVEWVRNYAQGQINAGEEVEFWMEARDWCAAMPDMTVPENYFHYLDYLRRTNASRKDPEAPIEGASITPNVVLNSYLSLGLFFNGGYLRSNFNILELNLSDDMERITTPSLVIWGRHDGINTIEMGFDAFESLGGPDFEDKELVILENSAHEGYLEEKAAFQAAFRAFINAYK